MLCWGGLWICCVCSINARRTLVLLRSITCSRVVRQEQGRTLLHSAVAVSVSGHLKAWSVLCRYVLSARTQDVVLEASGPSVKLEVGEGKGKLPAGRR